MDCHERNYHIDIKYHMISNTIFSVVWKLVSHMENEILLYNQLSWESYAWIYLYICIAYVKSSIMFGGPNTYKWRNPAWTMMSMSYNLWVMDNCHATQFFFWGGSYVTKNLQIYHGGRFALFFCWHKMTHPKDSYKLVVTRCWNPLKFNYESSKIGTTSYRMSLTRNLTIMQQSHLENRVPPQPLVDMHNLWLCDSRKLNNDQHYVEYYWIAKLERKTLLRSTCYLHEEWQEFGQGLRTNMLWFSNNGRIYCKWWCKVPITHGHMTSCLDTEHELSIIRKIICKNIEVLHVEKGILFARFWSREREPRR